jgi:integrase
LRVQYEGRRRDIGLGSVDTSGRGDADALATVPLLLRKTLTLAEAREKAATLRKMAQAGLDPVAERDRERAVHRIPTFAEVVKSAHEDLGKGWTAKNAAGFLASLEMHAVPHLGRRRVDEIGAGHVRDALAEIWTEKPAMAQKIRARIGQVLDYAHTRGWRAEAAPKAKQVRKGLAQPIAGGNFAAMPYRAVPEFVTGLLAKDDTPGRLALTFTILTAARSGEVRNARWEQVDLEDGTWKRPAEIMKSRKEHTVALSEAAKSVLARALPFRGATGLIFPGTGGRTLSDMTLTKALRTAGEAKATVHGFRSSFRDWTAEKMPTVPFAVAELALAHTVGNSTERAYLRSDLTKMRAALMEAWGAYCTGTATVDELAAARAKKGAA